MNATKEIFISESLVFLQYKSLPLLFPEQKAINYQKELCEQIILFLPKGIFSLAFKIQERFKKGF